MSCPRAGDPARRAKARVPDQGATDRPTLGSGSPSPKARRGHGAPSGDEPGSSSRAAGSPVPRSGPSGPHRNGSRWGALLARRSLGDPDDLASSPALVPAELSSQGLATVASTRWVAEPCLEEAKGETGLDQDGVRRWPGRHRHLTSSMPAGAWPAAIRRQAERQQGGVPRPGQLMAVAPPLPVSAPEPGLAWSWWGRAKRQRTRCGHDRRRALQGDHESS